MSFPRTRLRRNRRTEALRALVRENRLDPSALIQPFFVRSGRGQRVPVPSMPGVFQLSVDELLKEAGRSLSLGIRAVILFGIPDKKDPLGKEAYSPSGIVQKAVKSLKDAEPGLAVITDLCFCEYTDHGHCGVLEKGGRINGAVVDNDATLDLMARTALAQARAGADLVAPSGMMDGGVAAIRAALDESGHKQVGILAYAAKYASAFYGPFRDAAGSAPGFGDRRGYQMDPANAREALREIAADIEQGADILMVKPALPCLDVLRQAKDRFAVPMAAYNVSGEYAMVKAAAAKGWVDEKRAVLEILTSIKRAGADMILTYHAKEAAQWLATGKPLP